MSMFSILKRSIVVLALACCYQVAAATELTWYGHAAFKLKTPAGKILFIDPWITNPANANGQNVLAKIDKADLILVTHGHSDHVGDAAAIAKKTGARLVATFDLAQALAQFGGFPKEQMGFDTMGNFGGELSLLDGEVRIAFIPAVHSSAVTAADQSLHVGGNPGGFLITVKNGPTIYHTGDTDLFDDMALIPKFRRVDVMLACIGGHFTMGPDRAAEAALRVKPGKIVPMHFGTFPVLTGTPEALTKALQQKKSRIKVQVMKIGEPLELSVNKVQ